MKTKQLLLTAGISLALLSGCGKKEEVVAPEVVRPAQLYTVSDAATRYIQNFPALAAPSEESDLSFRVGGEIEQFPVVAGSHVKKGDIIAVLDQTDFKLEVARTKARYDLAVKTFERQERMLALELTSQAAFDEAEANRTLTKVAYENAKNNLGYTVIRAPFDGVVSKTNFEIGENIAPKQPLLSFHAENGLDITFQLPESILSRATKPDADKYQPKVSFTTSDEFKGKEFRAKFKEMDQEADPRSRSYKVTLSMPKPEGMMIVPGMTASVKIELDQILSDVDQYVLVPVEAVFSPADTDPADGKFAVWKLNTDTMTVHRQMVTIGELTDEGMKITSGLNADDIVVAAGVGSLLEGTKVRAWVKQRGI